MEHRVGDFEDLNISICYETENMHIKRDFKGISHQEANKCFNNLTLLNNPWHLRFRIGSATATTTQTRMEVKDDSNPDASAAFSMQRLMEVDDDSRTQNEGDAESESSETAFAWHPYARAQRRRNENYAWMSGMPGRSLTSWEREKLELQREIHSLQKDMKKLLDPKGK